MAEITKSPTEADSRSWILQESDYERVEPITDGYGCHLSAMSAMEEVAESFPSTLAVTFLARHLPSQEYVVLKCFERSEFEYEFVLRAVPELCELDHPNILRYYGYIQTGDGIAVR